jgi:hypothetical protein
MGTKKETKGSLCSVRFIIRLLTNIRTPIGMTAGKKGAKKATKGSFGRSLGWVAPSG